MATYTTGTIMEIVSTKLTPDDIAELRIALGLKEMQVQKAVILAKMELEYDDLDSCMQELRKGDVVNKTIIRIMSKYFDDIPIVA